MSYIVHKAIDITNLSKKAAGAVEGKTYLASPKYDGCHAVFCFDDGDFIGCYSRTGEAVLSMPHIADALQHHYDLSKGRLAICGEAWYPGHEFSELSGWFRRQRPVPELGFVPFDCVPWDYNTDTASGPVVHLGQYNDRAYTAPYSARIKPLVSDFTPFPSRVTRPIYFDVGPDSVVDKATLMALHYKGLGGYDGVILADPDGKYTVGAGKGGEFLKFKPLISESLVVKAVIADIGSKTGKHTCSLAVDFKGKIQMVSTGLTQAEVNEYVNNSAAIIGKTIEVEAMGITNTGLLREPRFRGVRTDVV